MPKEKAKRRWPDKNTEEYNEKRNQNNVAVKKSREKARQKAAETKQRVDGLKTENVALEHKVDTLKKELSVLKDLFTSHASGTAAPRPAPAGDVLDIRPSLTDESEDPALLDHIYSHTCTEEGDDIKPSLRLPP